MIRNLVALVGLVLLATGCVTTTNKMPQAEPAATGAMECEELLAERANILRVGVVTAKHDPGVESMKGLDQPYKDLDERRRRIDKVGPEFLRDLLANKIEPASRKRLLFRVYNANTDHPCFGLKHVQGFRITNPEGVTVEALDIQGTKISSAYDVDNLVFDETVLDLGEPDMMFTVDSTDGGAGAGFIWDIIRDTDDPHEGTYIAVCEIIGTSVYPGQVWVTNSYFNRILWNKPVDFDCHRDGSCVEIQGVRAYSMILGMSFVH